MATEARLDIDMQHLSDSCESAAPGGPESADPGGPEQEETGQPTRQGGGSLLAFAALLLLLLGGLALLIWVIQPFADQAGGCGGG
jgi:hypothetical protein